MMMYLEAADFDYLDGFHDGPYVPTKLVPQIVTDGKTIPEHYVVKDKAEWTTEEKNMVLKDAKVRNILHNSLDTVLSNRVIALKTAKEIWDTLEVQYKGLLQSRRTGGLC